MSKKAPKKKKNMKSFRVIRKTLGAICLITAIIVAAIPIPDLEAIGGTSMDTSVVDVIYSVSDNSLIEELKPSSGTEKAVTIYELSDGVYTLDWTYEYYMYDGTSAVISKYNDTYRPKDETLEINVNINKQYPYYSATDISNMFSASGRGNVLLTDEELQKYFASEYTAYLTAKKAYDTNPVGVEPVKPSKTASQLSESQKLEYFCDYTKYNGHDLNDYSLVQVLDKIGTVEGEPATTTYIPKMGNNFYVDLADKLTVKYIGDNAFTGATLFKKLIIPKEILTIGDGAFAGCSSIESVTIYSVKIGNRAFYGCSAIENVTIQTGATIIGTEAFSNCNRLLSISFPSSLKEIGQGAFSNCGYLATVDMSGITTKLVIDKFAFYGCHGLNTVKFCSTTNEIQEGAFAIASGINASGAWTSIQFPASTVTFGDYVLSGRSNVKNVTMPSNFGTNATALQPGFFRGCLNLAWVEFPDNGNGSCGYASFDTNAFIDVITESFYVRGPESNVAGSISSPRQSARKAGIPYVYKDKNGKSCYEVGNGSYLFLVDESGSLLSCSLIDSDSFDGIVEVPSKVGDINVVSIAEGCFSKDSALKSALTDLVIKDNSVTTIAEGAFQGFPALKSVKIGNSVKSIGANAFADCDKLTEVHFNTPKSGYSGFTIGTNAFATNGDSLIFYGDINPSYAPFVWAMEADNYMNKTKGIRVCYKTNAPTNLTVMRDNTTGLITLLDYPHYEQISANVIVAYEKVFIDGNNTGDVVISAEDIALVNATLNIAIPAGIQSIDVKAYMESGDNYNNCTTYLYAGNPNYSTYKSHGLFNGYYGNYGSALDEREYPAGSNKELVNQGNDRIKSVTMVDVQYLPNNAFYSCENLQVVSLGNACKDIGVAPFAGCTSLGSIAGNTYYSCVNGIIYNNNTDGTKNIVEGLSGRGLSVGAKNITLETDPLLANVTTIAEGAFQDCTGINRVDLSSLSKLTIIPKNCFDGCINLRTVILPDSVTEIRANAFTSTDSGIAVTIPAKEVEIDNNAFDYGAATIRTYANTAAATYAKTFGHDLEIIDDIYTVYFLDYDSTQLGAVQYIESGKSATAPTNPTRTGYTFSGWSKAYNNITKDTIVIALYKINATTSGNTTTGNTTTSSNTTTSNTVSANAVYLLTVESGSGDGSYKKGVPVIIKADAAPSGKVFDKWVGSTTDIGIASSTSEITTIVMPAHEVIMIATYKNSNSTTSATTGNNSSANSVSGNNTSGITSGSGTTVNIDKSGISNKDMASATVEGSTDNFIVKITDSEEARQAVEAALLNEYGTLENISYFAMDISLYDSTGTTKITDTTGIKVNITMPIPDDLITYAGNNKAASVVDEKLDKMTPKFTSIDGVSCITFTATHFSPYTIYVDTANLTSGITDSTPQTGDGIHPKWFLAVGLICLSAVLFLKKDKEVNLKIA